MGQVAKWANLTYDYSSKMYWDNYYKSRRPQEIPWTGVQVEFFNRLWKKFKLPNHGTLLDVGCGRGDKAIFFAKKGFRVWAFDISETAIKEAKKASENLGNPLFFVADATRLEQVKEIKDVKFDIVLDKLASQFLSRTEKRTYLSALQQNLKPETIFILQCFGKRKQKSQFENLPKWIKEISLSPEDVKEVYGTMFNVVSHERKITGKGHVVDTYVMQVK